MKIRTIIVEDEPLARERLRDLLAADDEIELVAECADGSSAVTQITELQPDLLFLDIQLPEQNGFEVLEALDLDQLPAVVFVTAYDSFALKAFEVHAIDYLLKPFDRERFESALRRAREQIRRNTPQEQSVNIRELIGSLRERKGARRIAIKTSGKVTFLRTDQIDCVEAADNYVNVRSGGQSLMARETLTAFEGRLPSEDFVRISRSCIVNLDRIKELQPLFHGEYAVILRDGTRLTLSRGYRENLKRLMGEEE